MASAIRRTRKEGAAWATCGAARAPWEACWNSLQGRAARASDYCCQLIRIHGLDEVMIEPRLHCTAPITFLPPAGQRDEHHVPCPNLCAHCPRNVIPAHVGHADIEDHGIRP